MRIWMDCERMTERPEIEILYVGKDDDGVSHFAANCPVGDCEWAETVKGQENFSEIEDQVYAHEQWHEDGMPD